jgi:FeS assembly SUF system regulator
MLKLAKLTDYAVVILAEMAGSGDQCLPASALADKTRLPEPTVAKVLKQLGAGGIVVSVRGAAGGYRLDARPEDLSVAYIIQVMEGPIALTACVDHSAEPCQRAGSCAVNGRWNKVNMAVKRALDQVTLADLMPAKTKKLESERAA